MCPHWIWHDLFSNPSEKGELPELTLKLFEHGVLHEEEYTKGLEFIEVKEIDAKKAFKKTIELMRTGVPLIYQGELQYSSDEIQYRGRPDLLKKYDGKSSFGDYYYVPIEIKSSKEIKTEQKYQLILYGIILEKIQGKFPEELSIINRDRQNIFFKMDDKIREKTVNKITEIIEVMKGKKPPLKLTSTYKQTPWFDKCVRDAEETKDIALIYKLDSRSHSALRKNGIESISDFVNTNTGQLPKIPYAPLRVLNRAKQQADSLMNNKLVWLAKPDIPDSNLKIYFDIEGDPLLQVEYLFGFWIVGDAEKKYAKFGKVVDYRDEQKYFIYFLAEKPEEEYNMWINFLKWVDILPKDNFFVYHYADYERSRTKNLSEKYKSTNSFIQFSSKYVDLLKVVQNSIIFPLYFYSIKDIAKSSFLKYSWRHEKAGGSQSIFWYEKWIETNDRKVLQDIINYNEDDVRATEFLHNWLNTQYEKY